MTDPAADDGRDNPAVYVIDDDSAVRDALQTLVDSVGLTAHGFDNADAFLAAIRPDTPGCLVTDICLPGTDGIQLQRLMIECGIELPLIAMSAHGDITMAVEMVRRGALDFIEKPFRNHLMLQRIHEALEHDVLLRRERSRRADLQQGLQRLTPRERDILPLLLEGLSNKHIARALELSPRTVETHRANLLRKMQAESVTALAKQLAGVTLHHR